MPTCEALSSRGKAQEALHASAAKTAFDHFGQRVFIRGVVEVTEVTRTGTVVRTARFMASRIIALVEHPADTTAAD